MLGGVSAPPPEDTIHQTTDILSCFTDDGLPIASSQLSPISKVTTTIYNILIVLTLFINCGYYKIYQEIFL